MTFSVRIGVDTGGTFTDVVLVDDETGQIITTKTPLLLPIQPRDSWQPSTRSSRPMAAPATSARWRRSSTARRSPPTCSSKSVPRACPTSGSSATEGFEFILEIARQSVPDGYGNSYFWVKPPRIVPVHRVKTVGGRLDHLGRGGPAVRRGGRPSGWRGGSRSAGSPRSASASSTRTLTRSTSGACCEVLAREHPEAVVSDLQRRAAGVPRVRAVGHHPGGHRGQAGDPAVTSATSAERLGRRVSRS